jgi:hypothetical protein
MKARLNRQTFIDVAEAICATTRSQRISELELHGIKMAAYNIADKFADRAGNFDRSLFIRNCGFEE